MAREQGFQITIRAWAKVDKTKPHSMIAGAELAEGKSIEHALSVLGLVDIAVSSVYTSKAAPTLPPPPVPEAPENEAGPDSREPLPDAPPPVVPPQDQAVAPSTQKPFDPVEDRPAFLTRTTGAKT